MLFLLTLSHKLSCIRSHFERLRAAVYNIQFWGFFPAYTFCIHLHSHIQNVFSPRVKILLACLWDLSDLWGHNCGGTFLQSAISREAPVWLAFHSISCQYWCWNVLWYVHTQWKSLSTVGKSCCLNLKVENSGYCACNQSSSQKVLPLGVYQKIKSTATSNHPPWHLEGGYGGIDGWMMSFTQERFLVNLLKILIVARALSNWISAP